MVLVCFNLFILILMVFEALLTYSVLFFSLGDRNGTVNDTTPSYEYEPIVGTPPAFLNTTAKDASSESGENSTSSSSSGSTKSGAGVTISTGVSLAMFGAMFAGFLPLFI